MVADPEGMHPDEAVFRLALADLADRVDLGVWWASGLTTNPAVVRELVTVLPWSGPEEWVGYVDAGLPAERIRSHWILGIRADDVRLLGSLGITDPGDQEQFYARMDPRSLRAWLDAGVESAADALTLRDAGLSPPTVKRMSRLGMSVRDLVARHRDPR